MRACAIVCLYDEALREEREELRYARYCREKTRYDNEILFSVATRDAALRVTIRYYERTPHDAAHAAGLPLIVSRRQRGW